MKALQCIWCIWWRTRMRLKRRAIFMSTVRSNSAPKMILFRRVLRRACTIARHSSPSLWLSVCLWTKWLWIWILLSSLKLQIWYLLRTKSSLTFKQTIVCGFTLKLVCDMIKTYNGFLLEKVFFGEGLTSWIQRKFIFAVINIYFPNF